MFVFIFIMTIYTASNANDLLVELEGELKNSLNIGGQWELSNTSKAGILPRIFVSASAHII